MSPWWSRWSWVRLVKAATEKWQPSTRPQSRPWDETSITDRVDATGTHVAQGALQVEALGRGVDRTQYAFAGVTHLDGADQPRVAIGGAQDRLGEVGRRGLPIGAGHADQVELVTRAPEEARGHGRESATRIGHLDDAGRRSESRQKRRPSRPPVRWHPAAPRPRDSRGRPTSAASQREEEIARADLARVVAEPPDHGVCPFASRPA